jgi:hypothetical protein
MKQNWLITKAMQVAFGAAALVAGSAQAASGDPAPDYIFPGLGTLAAALWSLLR